MNCTDLVGFEKEIVSVWVPCHVGITGKLAADSALFVRDGDISDEPIPFSDLKPRMKKICHGTLADRRTDGR